MRSMSQRRYLVPQDLDAVTIRPVVENGTEEIDFGSLERLLFQKAIGHERHPVFQYGRRTRGRTIRGVWKVLYNEF